MLAVFVGTSASALILAPHPCRDFENGADVIANVTKHGDGILTYTSGAEYVLLDCRDRRGLVISFDGLPAEYPTHIQNTRALLKEHICQTEPVTLREIAVELRETEFDAEVLQSDAGLQCVCEADREGVHELPGAITGNLPLPSESNYWSCQ